MEHYFGLTYAKPHEAGLASEAKAVGKRLGELLDALGNINSWVIESGPLTQACDDMRFGLIDKLKADGWRVSVPKNNYRVLPPKASRRKAA